MPTKNWMINRLLVCAEEMQQMAEMLERGGITKLSENEFAGAGTHQAIQALLEIPDEEY